LSHLTPEQVRAYRIADNRLSELSGWDDELLAAELHALNAAGFDLGLTGFEGEDLERLLAPLDEGDGLAGDDVIPEPPLNPVSRPGDLWLLDDHRLLCGDSTKADDVVRVMNGEKATLFATDPPYLVDYDGTNHPSKQGAPDKNKDWGNSYGITWDDSSQGPELYEGFIKAAIEHAILPNAAWYCWHASRRQAMVEGVWEKYGAFVHQQIVWAKDRGILTRSYYLWQHEPCFFGWIKGNKPPRISDDYPGTVWPLPTVKVGEKTDHPTSKPVEVFAIPMRQHARPGEVCYEPFAGSGSQIIAGETTGRRVFAIEISPQYVDVAVRRWQTAAGKPAKLDGDGRTFDEVADERLPKAA
jgi:DNA modification methylase